MRSAEEQTDALAHRMGVIADARLRTTYLRHTLLTMAPPAVVDLLIVARTRAEARSERHAHLLSSLSLALAHDDCAALRDTLAALLIAREQHGLARSLTRSDADDDAEARRVPDFGKGRAVTLGERKSLARRVDREMIARVLRDPHPQVIRILLDNPGLIEADVLRLCARRPVAVDVLREVFRSQRWIVRYPIKTALILNPFTPLEIALQLAPLMHEQDLRRVLEAPELAPELRTACERRTDLGELH